MFWSVPNCEFPRPCMFAEKVEIKHFDVLYLMALKSSQKIQSGKTSFAQFQQRAFCPLLCFTEKMINFFQGFVFGFFFGCQGVKATSSDFLIGFFR